MNELIDELKKSEQQIYELHELWHIKTMPLIKSELEKFVYSFGPGLKMEVNDLILNHESIILSFTDVKSGLYYNDNNPFNEMEKKHGSICKEVARLIYSIQYRGQVSIFMVYPSVKGIIEHLNPIKEFKSIKQDEITQQTISENVKVFFQEVTKWYKGEIMEDTRPNIGFVLKEPSK